LEQIDSCKEEEEKRQIDPKESMSGLILGFKKPSLAKLPQLNLMIETT